MRIAYLTSAYPFVSHTFVLREVLELRRLGHEVETFSVMHTEEDQLLSEVDREEHARTYSLMPPRPIDVLRAHLAAFRGSPRGYLSALAKGIRLGPRGVRGRVIGFGWFVVGTVLWHQCRERGVRHVHVHLANAGPPAALIAAGIGNSHGGERWTWSWTIHGPTEFYDAWQQRLGDKAAEALFVVCISHYARSQLLTFLDERHWPKVHVVRTGTDPDYFAPAEAGGSSNGTVEILSVGRLVPFKGHRILIEAIARLAAGGAPVQATLVGDGDKRASLEQMARELGVEDRVKFTGAVGHDNIREYYERADIFCLPSFGEGVPVVLMEAMARELPVVSSRIMGIPELIDNGVSGFLLSPGNVDELSVALQTLVDDPDRRIQMGRAGREKVVREFDARASTRQLEALLVEELEAG